jgi:hypothetical protein
VSMHNEGDQNKRNGPSKLVGPVESPLRDLDDKRGIGECESLKVCGVLEVCVSINRAGWRGVRTGVGTSAPVTRSTGASR